MTSRKKSRVAVKNRVAIFLHLIGLDFDIPSRIRLRLIKIFRFSPRLLLTKAFSASGEEFQQSLGLFAELFLSNLLKHQSNVNELELMRE